MNQKQRKYLEQIVANRVKANPPKVGDRVLYYNGNSSEYGVVTEIETVTKDNRFRFPMKFREGEVSYTVHEQKNFKTFQWVRVTDIYEVKKEGE